MDLGTDDQLVEQIFQVNQSERAFILRELKEFDLNLVQARALIYIGNHPGLIQKKLAAHIGKQGATTTNILKVLESRAFIIRQVQASNERQKQLYLSPSGQETAARVKQIFIALEQQANSGLSAADQATLLALLQRVQANVEAAE
ncbi:MarR family transcriptional regulator [Lacticaseibacillus pabuli]|uniref:MarR family transcriptional regulator n=1 Tax=Lacticaseibacillus pabuli TaxID=3025672 RepID=A0ABY7WNE5_9LACO|nr:MarR family transcriptional regulator [Lacticaseibacillus sp. KACC 23028]WDF81723.1 MarR family transcriptional regulator [Lacticaseibacillus sp. KACC 23028]